MFQPDTCTVPSPCHRGRRCSYRGVCSQTQTFHPDNLQQIRWDVLVFFLSVERQDKNLNTSQTLISTRGQGSSYPGRSSLHDDPVGIFFGILRSRGRKKLLLDRRTSSHSLPRKCPGHILEAEQEEKIPLISCVDTWQPSWSASKQSCTLFIFFLFLIVFLQSFKCNAVYF